MNTTLTKIDQKTRKIGQIYIWNPMTTELYHVNIDLCHQYGISVAESQTFLRMKRPQRRRARRNGCFHRLWICVYNDIPIPAIQYYNKKLNRGQLLWPAVCMLINKVSNDACQWNGHEVVISVGGIFYIECFVCRMTHKEKLYIQWPCGSNFRCFAQDFCS